MLRLVLALGWEFGKNEIIKAVLEEFISRGLDKTYAKEIEEWKKYKREQKFAKKLNKEMRKEVECFQRELEKWTPKELKEFVIEGLDCLEK